MLYKAKAAEKFPPLLPNFEGKSISVFFTRQFCKPNYKY